MSPDLTRWLQLLALSPVLWAAGMIACQALARALARAPRPHPDDDWL